MAKFNSSGALIYFTHYGGNGGDFGGDIAVDSSGNAYVTGTTTSTDFPTANPFQPAFGGGSSDAFVTKFNSSGSAMVYSTYLGGSSSDFDGGIVVDSSGNAYVLGSTSSINFPTANPFDATYGGGLCGGFPLPSYPCSDAFVTKFNPSGSALVYSTYLGGSSDDVGSGGIAVDPSGNVYMTGYTKSTNFPTANPLQPAYAGSTDAFVTKFNSSASALVYSTYLGGSNDEIGYGIAVNSSGDAYVTGYTNSINFPTANPLQPAKASGTDAFVTKFNPAGSALLYSSYHGGSGSDLGRSIAVDSSGSAYVTGDTTSTDFPLANPLQPAHGGQTDVLVTKFNSSGSFLLYSSYLGGSGSDLGRGIAVDSSNNVYVTGETNSTNFPTANPIQPANGGGYDAFLTKIGGLVPVFEITMSAATYVNGQTVTAPEFRVQNPSAGPIAVRLRVWLSGPGVGEVNLLDTGGDGSFFLPPLLNQNIGPLSLFQVTPSFPPKGNWQLNSRIEDPTTGVLLSQDINPFVIQ